MDKKKSKKNAWGDNTKKYNQSQPLLSSNKENKEEITDIEDFTIILQKLSQQVEKHEEIVNDYANNQNSSSGQKDQKNYRKLINDMREKNDGLIKILKNVFQNQLGAENGWNKVYPIQFKRLTNDFFRIIEKYRNVLLLYQNSEKKRERQNEIVSKNENSSVSKNQTSNFIELNETSNSDLLKNQTEENEEDKLYGGDSILKQKTLETYKLTDWQDSTLKVEKQMALETNKIAIEMESSMVEINHLFEDFKDLVAYQGEGLKIIDKHVDNSIVNVERGVEELKLSNKYKTQGTLLMLLVIGLLILGVFGALIVILVGLVK